MAVKESELFELRKSGLSEDEITTEVEDRNRRAHNVIFFNLLESAVSDLQQVTDILAPLSLPPYSFTCSRLGQKSVAARSVPAPARPVLVVFSSPVDALYVLRNRQRLKLSGKSVSVKQDETLWQRAKLKEARATFNNFAGLFPRFVDQDLMDFEKAVSQFLEERRRSRYCDS